MKARRPNARKRRDRHLGVAAAAALLLLLGTGASQPSKGKTNDYPTADRADYVIGCMAANGNTQESLMKCSCAIDVIADRMPYPDYDEAKTALSLAQGGGERLRVFASTPQMQKLIQNLHQAQAEANIQCFK